VREEKLIAAHRGRYENGEPVTVCEYQEFIVEDTLSSGRIRVPGLRRLATQNGAAVNAHSDGTYETVTGRKIILDTTP
jgi:hypothetical protein